MTPPVLVYDGACGFCVRNVAFLEKKLKLSFVKKSFREEGFFNDHPYLSPERCEKEITLILSDGSSFYGAEAIAKLISNHRLFGFSLSIYRLPCVRQVADFVYKNVSKYRFHLRYWER